MANKIEEWNLENNARNRIIQRDPHYHHPPVLPINSVYSPTRCYRDILQRWDDYVMERQAHEHLQRLCPGILPFLWNVYTVADTYRRALADTLANKRNPWARERPNYWAH